VVSPQAGYILHLLGQAVTLNEIESTLETVKSELGIHAIRADEQGKFYLGAVERVVAIALDHLSVAKMHEETREHEVAF
jgi:hypothetical protein